MKMNRFLLIVCIVIFGSTNWTYSENNISTEQIRLLMEASRSRYQNLETTIEMKEYRGDEIPKSDDKLIASQNLTLRKMSHGLSFQRDAVQYQENPKKEIHLRDQAAWVNGRWKEMNILTDPSEKIEDRSAQINSHRRFGPYRGVYEAIWGLAGYGDRNWFKMGARIRAGQVTSDNGFIRLEMRANEKESAPWVLVWIDPEKGYIPFKHTVLYSDKHTVYMVESTAKWVQINSLWVPLSFSRYIAPLKTRQEYRVDSIRVNEPIAPERLDFQFPEGITVVDRVLGVEYKFQQSQTSGADIHSTNLPSMGRISPSSDPQLAEAATKAMDLVLEIQKSTAPTDGNIQFVQEYVWVLPGKNQYTLELSTDTKTKPVLSRKSISDSPLVLYGVDDQLATSGKLIVTLERPEGHKAFADAVLTLDFGGTKTPIHFVAAPLP